MAKTIEKVFRVAASCVYVAGCILVAAAMTTACSPKVVKNDGDKSDSKDVSDETKSDGESEDDDSSHSGATYRPHVMDRIPEDSLVFIPGPGRPRPPKVGTNPEDGLYAPKTLIVSYDTEIGKEPLLKAIEDYGAEVIYDYRIINAIALKIPEEKDIHEAMKYFGEVEGVIHVNRDRIYQLMDTAGPQVM